MTPAETLFVGLCVLILGSFGIFYVIHRVVYDI